MVFNCIVHFQRYIQICKSRIVFYYSDCILSIQSFDNILSVSRYISNFANRILQNIERIFHWKDPKFDNFKEWARNRYFGSKFDFKHTKLSFQL